MDLDHLHQCCVSSMLIQESTPCSWYTVCTIGSQDHTVFLLHTLLNLVFYGTQHFLALDYQPKRYVGKLVYVDRENSSLYFHSDPPPNQKLHHIRMSEFFIIVHINAAINVTASGKTSEPFFEPIFLVSNSLTISLHVDLLVTYSPSLTKYFRKI